MTLDPGERIGPYQVISEIAKGGMSRVYKAQYSVTGQERAVKVLPPDSPQDKVDALRWEGDIGALLGEHPNLVRVYDYGEQDGWLYLGMDFVDGANVEKLLDGGKKLETRRSLEIARDIAFGLEHMHRKNIFHADVKPGNFLVDSQKARLSDFGTAYDGNRMLPPHNEDIIVCTLQYTAPERVTPKSLQNPDARSDVYSLGASLYHMLAGRPPFEVPEAQRNPYRELMYSVRFDKPSPVSRFEPGVPASVEEICMRALEKDPSKRFKSMQEISAVIQGALVPK